MRLARIVVTGVVILAVGALAGCGGAKAPAAGGSAATSGTAEAGKPPLPASAYSADPAPRSWIDTQTGYDVDRSWKLDGGEWPVMLIMSPSQSPHALYGFSQGLFKEKLQRFGITPRLEKIDGPPRTFHALERSKWPFVYMPLAVFEDYARSPQNQGGAGGLQYVAIAGSTSGGGYTLVTKDSAVKSVADLKGKTVAFQNTNPVPGTLLTRAVENVGLKVGDGPGDVHIAFGPAGEQINKYERGGYAAMITLNIYKAALFKSGSRPVTDFADVGFRPNYTILVVERSVLEKRPEVVKAFLEAHYAADVAVRKPWSDGAFLPTLLTSWNDYFASQSTKWSSQRPVPDTGAYKAMLGNMHPDVRLDRSLLDACFEFNTVHGTWGWKGSVDPKRMVDYETFNEILKANGQPLQ